MTQVSVRVVVFQEGDWVCAQCLEHDIAAQAKTLEDCLYELERLIVGHIALEDSADGDPISIHRQRSRWSLCSQLGIPAEDFGLSEP